MSLLITPEIEELVESLFQSGSYADRGEVLLEALSLLKHRKDVMKMVQEGIADLDRGYFTEYDDSSRERFRLDVGMANPDRMTGPQ